MWNYTLKEDIIWKIMLVPKYEWINNMIIIAGQLLRFCFLWLLSLGFVLHLCFCAWSLGFALNFCLFVVSWVPNLGSSTIVEALCLCELGCLWPIFPNGMGSSFLVWSLDLGQKSVFMASSSYFASKACHHWLAMLVLTDLLLFPKYGVELCSA